MISAQLMFGDGQNPYRTLDSTIVRWLRASPSRASRIWIMQMDLQSESVSGLTIDLPRITQSIIRYRQHTIALETYRTLSVCS